MRRFHWFGVGEGGRGRKDGNGKEMKREGKGREMGDLWLAKMGIFFVMIPSFLYAFLFTRLPEKRFF